MDIASLQVGTYSKFFLVFKNWVLHTKTVPLFWGIAQLVERLTLTQKAGGSNPSIPTMNKKKRLEKLKQDILKVGIKEYVRRMDEIAMEGHEHREEL